MQTSILVKRCPTTITSTAMFTPVDFRSFQRSYYLLYQSFTPTTLHIILQRYTIPKSLETRILKQFNWRTVNQSLLNYLLIELRRDKNDAKFWETLMMMIKEPQLKKVVNNYASLKGSTYEYTYNVYKHVHNRHTYAHRESHIPEYEIRLKSIRTCVSTSISIKISYYKII